MLKAFIFGILDYLVARVYGHYTHPYTIYFVLPPASPKRGYEVEFIGTFEGVMGYARRQLRAGKAVSYKITTRGGYKCAEGGI